MPWRIIWPGSTTTRNRMSTQTHTVVHFPVSRAAYYEIKKRLKKASQSHRFMRLCAGPTTVRWALDMKRLVEAREKHPWPKGKNTSV
jgi:hypothetical protein